VASGREAGSNAAGGRPAGGFLPVASAKCGINPGRSSQFAVFSSLFRPGGRQHARIAQEAKEIRLGFADARVRVVGVSHYQEALREIAGANAGEAVRHEATAALQPEPENPHDPGAITVTIGGTLVGYLSRDDAVRYGPAVRILRESGRVLTCAAVIGGRGPDSETANLGVFLQLPSPTEAEMEARSVAGP
jgi:hypothetical protein